MVQSNILCAAQQVVAQQKTVFVFVSIFSTRSQKRWYLTIFLSLFLKYLLNTYFSDSLEILCVFKPSSLPKPAAPCIHVAHYLLKLHCVEQLHPLTPFNCRFCCFAAETISICSRRIAPVYILKLIFRNELSCFDTLYLEPVFRKNINPLIAFMESYFANFAVFTSFLHDFHLDRIRLLFPKFFPLLQHSLMGKYRK